MSNTPSAVRPWYKHAWPWILMAGPAIVVVAGIYTFWLAVVSFDGMVAVEPAKPRASVTGDKSPGG